LRSTQREDTIDPMSSFRRSLALASFGLLGASSLVSLGACAPDDIDDLFSESGGQGGANTGGAGPSTSSGPTSSSSSGTSTSSTTSSTTTTTTGTGGAPPGCGDGVQDDGEQCDGADLDGADCKDVGFADDTPGAPVCTSICTLDYSGCKPTCGNGETEPGEQCDDGNTANGDGCSSTCTNEPTGCAVASPVALSFGPPTQIYDTTVGGQSNFNTTTAPCGSAPGLSRVFAVTAASSGFLTAWLEREGTAFDSVLYVRSSCNSDASTLLCANHTSGSLPVVQGGGEVVSVPVQQGQTYYFVVDGAAGGAQGDFALFLDLSTGESCQDPVPINVWPGGSTTAIGATTGKNNDTLGSCGGNSAPDVVYRINRRSNLVTSMEFELDSDLTDFDSILYARNGSTQQGSVGNCTNSQLQCDDVEGDMGGEIFDLVFEQNNVRYIWVDGYMGAFGNYGLNVTPSP
jgi:cysteine-rich repeat protein